MHDPMTVAFDGGWFTIWHVDPERCGDDDSCGWFPRSRHGDPEMLRRIEKAFEFEWDSSHGGWFDAAGDPRLSVSGIVLDMFRFAAWEFFSHNRRRTDAFLRRNLAAILMFAENNVDSLQPAITNRYGTPNRREKRIAEFASIVYGWILRDQRPWFKHPRWHLWHWRVDIHALRQLQRWAWSRCKVCGGRFRYGESPLSCSWHSRGPRWFRGEPDVMHLGCDRSGKEPQP